MPTVLLIDKEFDPKQLTPDLQRVYANYLALIAQKSAFKVLFPMRKRNPEVYAKQCVILTSKVKYICYDQRRQHFTVRPSINGKRIYLGATEDFDDACDMLKLFIQETIN